MGETEDQHLDEALIQREQEAIEKIEAAEAANRQAVSALSDFWREIRKVQNELSTRPSPISSALERR